MKKGIKPHIWISIICKPLQFIRICLYKISYRLLAIVYSVCDNSFDYIPIKNVSGIYKVSYLHSDNRGHINCGLKNIKDSKDVVELKDKYHKWLTDFSKYSKHLYLKLNFKRGFLTNWEYVNPKTLKPCGKDLHKIGRKFFHKNSNK